MGVAIRQGEARSCEGIIAENSESPFPRCNSLSLLRSTIRAQDYGADAAITKIEKAE
jgi:hypothetical protein